MLRHALIVGCLALAGVGGPMSVAADPAKDIVGAWEDRSGSGGFKEIWTVENVKGVWTVKGVFKKGDEEAGSWIGKSPRFAIGTLTFIQEYVQKPNASWSDGNVMTAKATGDKLSFRWQAAKNSGTNNLDRAGDTVASKPKDPPYRQQCPKGQGRPAIHAELWPQTGSELE